MLSLKEEREKAGYTIDDIAFNLNIRKQYIIAIEEGRYDELPSKVYLNGYIKIYKKFLNISDTDKKDKNIKNQSKTQIQKLNNQRNEYSYLFITLSTTILLIVVVIFYKIFL